MSRFTYEPQKTRNFNFTLLEDHGLDDLSFKVSFSLEEIHLTDRSLHGR